MTPPAPYGAVVGMAPQSPAARSAGYHDVAATLQSGQRFLLTGHRSPDGDTLGSALALAHALEAAGKEARVVMRDRWGTAYACLPGIERVEVRESLPEDWPEGWSAILVMECPSAARTGFPELGRGRVVNIDHHLGNERYGAVNLLELDAAATGEMVADLLDLLEWPITPEIATNLWVALVTDTGSFRFSNTTAKALALGARLVAAGARPGEVNDAIFESRPPAAVRTEGLVLGTLELHAGGRVATLEAPRSLLEATSAQSSDLEGLVNRARGIDGVRAAAFLTEANGVIRCSFRSKGSVDVRSVAAAHGGGGHRNAAGCDIAGGLGEVKALLVRELAGAVDSEAHV